ncbi:MAG TPA: FecR domain-containing protein [Prolixibacteraceae bacterium]|nr:FecR domain-containing protein [Prolixibacteraceae bacterium]
MNEHLQYLVQKHFEGKLTIKENIEFSELLADQKNLEVEHLLDDTWRLQLNSEAFPDRNLTSVLDKVHHHIRLNENIKPKQLTWGQSFQRVAAILIIPLLLSFVAYSYFQNKKTANIISYAEIQCPLGVRVKFQLPDGSTGFLNSGSKLKYPVVFSKQRTVDLTGEAYFDVVHNEDIPFHVNTRNLDIKVLGTTFNVIANEDEKIEEIVLQNGKVNVLSKNGKQLAVLLPNEQLTLNTENQTFIKKDIIAAQYISWKEGKLVFRNENMQQVACRLSRWYNVEVLVEGHLLDDYTFHATFIDEPLDEVLKLISITTPITYKEERRTSDKEGIYLKRKIILRVNKLKINQFR